MRIVRVLGLLIVVLVLAGCGELSLAPDLGGGDGPDLISGQPNPEAFAVALWLSRELKAPTDLYERVLSDLTLIRDKFRDSIPAVDLQFHEPWEPGRLILGFDHENYQLVSDGGYFAWDSLNALFNLAQVDLSMSAFSIAKLDFDDELNPEFLAEAYRRLPGVRFAVPNRYMGERPMLVPARANDGRLLYFFRNAWDDCPSGCLYSEYWVLTIIDGRIVYDGYFSDKTMMPDDLVEAFEPAWSYYWQGSPVASQIASFSRLTAN